MPKGFKMEGGQKVISRSRNKAAIVMVISTLPTTAAYFYLPTAAYLVAMAIVVVISTYLCILSSNGNSDSNIYLPTSTYLRNSNMQ